ncbi:MAG: ABC-F family ATP-binding cassette domain-containing protein [Oscillospiraceae bacterium]|jgi:ATP-binding cassette subfamily F protein 3|nr:ABC-F family ATP-binding cassette domain-containing protein [Oscillospiraceae bacterium]
MLIQLKNITKSFGENTIIREADISIEEGRKYGLIGPNGAGKTTLLKIISGEMEADSGETDRSRSLFAGYLRQDSGLNPGNSIYGEMKSVFTPVLEKLRELEEVGERLKKLEPGSPGYAEISHKYADYQNYVEVHEGYNIDYKIKNVLNGMGFEGRDTGATIKTLSGGEKTRLALAKLLLEEPNLLILDEPTNHLDFKTLSWLEAYLKRYKGAVLLVSHDRYFLDSTVGAIYEIEHMRLNYYPGNYSRYLILKQEKQEREEKEYEAQQEEIAKMEDFVRRNLVRASTSNRAKSRVKALERMERLEAPKKAPRKIRLRFETASEPWREVLKVKEIDVTVGQGSARKTLVPRVSFEMRRGEKVALIGANGVGKTTLLKILIKKAQFYTGRISWGENTKIAYFEQESKDLNPANSVITELWNRYRTKTEYEIRSRLASVGIGGEDVYKKVGVISGGEKAKLKFCILSFQPSNVILMDEPSNHLDLPSKEVLEDALFNYSGTLLFVSHDRYLLNKIATRIIELTDGGIIEYQGNYEAYKEAADKKPPQESRGRGEVKKSEPEPGTYRSRKQRSLDVQKKRELASLEKSISDTEAGIAALEAEISEERVFSDYVLMQEKCAEIEAARALLENLMAEWENFA